MGAHVVQVWWVMYISKKLFKSFFPKYDLNVDETYNMGSLNMWTCEHLLLLMCSSYFFSSFFSWHEDSLPLKIILEQKKELFQWIKKKEPDNQKADIRLDGQTDRQTIKTQHSHLTLSVPGVYLERYAYISGIVTVSVQRVSTRGKLLVVSLCCKWGWDNRCSFIKKEEVEKMSGNFAYRSIIYWEFTTAESTLTHAYTYKEKNQALEQGDQ